MGAFDRVLDGVVNCLLNICDDVLNTLDVAPVDGGDMDASTLATIPRLRISRFSPQSNDQVLTPVAGPSHNPDFLHADDDDEDAESTPRMAVSAISDRQSPQATTTPGLPAETPAARLRALLARVPNTPDSATPHAPSFRPPAPPSISEPDSDFEPPYPSAMSSSIARESLKELFSRALRSPGNTPRKGKLRRNSIDASEVEASPRVEEERAKYKGKRRSLSDEEAEKSKHIEPSERSFRSSSAASAFDALRQRLDGSTSVLPSLPAEQMVMDVSMPPFDSSTDMAMLPPAPVDSSSEMPPYATSTPMRTFQMSAHLHMQSTSRASSSLSGADYQERHGERLHERERGWNSPLPKSPGHLSKLDPSHRHSWGSPGSGRASPAHRLSRKDSSASLVSTDDGRSSRASSVSSRADYDQRKKTLEQERIKQREKEWNRPHTRLSRSSSSLTLNKTPPVSLSTPDITRWIAPSQHPSTPNAPSGSKLTLKEAVPRPKSPLAHSTAENKMSPHPRAKSPATTPADKAETSQTGYKSRFGWSFPAKRTPLPPLELDQDSPQKPASRPSSRTSLSTTPSHIPVRSPRKGAQESSTAGHSEKKRSHRRSVTELAESVGSIPPRIEVSGEVGDELPSVPIVNSHDDFSSASEDESQAVTSTPTVRPVPLPPPEVSTTPVSEAPFSNGYSSLIQETQIRPESPPLTPPATDAQPLFSLQTPPRRPQFQTPKAEFETPPPPRGMPELPGPPSSDEEEDDHTPVMHSTDIPADLTSLKTPRPPGAWLATPAPSRQSTNEPVERAGSAPPASEQPSSSHDGGLATPPATLSRASSLPAQTPAPPGGWVNTPAPDTTMRRKGILKVRFEVESETASEGTFERPSADSSAESKTSGNELPEASWSLVSRQNGDLSTSSAPAEQSSADTPPTPPSLRERIRKKSPSIRLVDAYGREQVEAAPGPPPVHEIDAGSTDLPRDSHVVDPATPRRERQATTSATPRNWSTIRLVDAMGRAIEESPPEEESSADPPRSRDEAIERIRATLSSMNDDLNEADRINGKAVFDVRSYASLEERSRNAKIARSKITKSLQMAQMAEVEMRKKHPALQERPKDKATLPSTLLSKSPMWRLVVVFVVLQLIFLVIMYRYSLVQARKMFLTTYYDPFYPELYRYLAKPDTSLSAIPACPSWSILSAFNSLQHAGIKGVAADVWASATCSISSYFQSLWLDISHAQDRVTHSWPPT
ncbi:hypothetical protein BN946_scf184871.g11 [Trametes cinnabarina]|uniref:Uncharacterized protein n=1 Tax=Pycnoporus cinnabarinus TaxID=5643 RepID=A0A060SMA0_PYCCI|nr:hypothetical protein BN946_scf184871.g11 [Trametes cinnabarina]